MRRPWSFLFASLLALSCRQNINCPPSAAKPLVIESLQRESRAPLRLFWSEALQRPKLVHGSFPVQAGSAEEAARAFLTAHAALFQLDPKDLRATTHHQGKLGTYYRYETTHRGVPIFDSEVIVHVVARDAHFEIRDVNLAQRSLRRDLSVSPKLSPNEALEKAYAALSLEAQAPLRAPAEITLGIQAQAREALLYRARVSPAQSPHSYEVLLDAQTGEVVSTRDRAMFAEGTGLIFDANPIASTGLTPADNNDADSAALDAARFSVTLPRLDGSGFLRGDFVDAKPQSEVRSEAQDLAFNFQRSQTGFEEVMSYFHIDRAQARIQEELGFTDVNNRQQEIFVEAFNEPNAFYDPADLTIRMGFGGVDSAEDADVILHEYGHSIQSNQVPGFGSSFDTAAMGEGFGDYLAMSMLDVLANREGHPQQNEPACLSEWFNGGNCIRRVDGTKHFPEGGNNQIHDDGEMWSAPLFFLRGEVGADVADTLVLESHFLLSASDDFLSAAQALVLADQNLFFGANEARLRRLLTEQGLLRDLATPPVLPDVLRAVEVSIDHPRDNSGNYFSDIDDSQFIEEVGAAGLRLHFSEIDTELDSFCFEGSCDNIYLYDAQGELFQIISGTHTDFTSVVIPGGSVRVRLASDGIINRFGYHIDRVEVMGIAPPANCGDGLLGSAEACDGANLAGKTCEDFDLAGVGLQCSATCEFDVTACLPSECLQ